IANQFRPGAPVFAGKDPSPVTPPKTPTRTGDILRLIGMAMVVAVMAGPPQRTPLAVGRGAVGHNELHDPAHFIRAVRKVAMEASGDKKGDEKIENCRNDQIALPMVLHKDKSKGENLHADKRQQYRPIQSRVFN